MKTFPSSEGNEFTNPVYWFIIDQGPIEGCTCHIDELTCQAEHLIAMGKGKVDPDDPDFAKA